MNTRIKFKYDTKKLEDATYGFSKQVFRVNGKEVRLFVHFKEFYFEVIDNDEKVIEKGGQTKNRAVLLRQAKRALVNLGVIFGDETRNRENKAGQEESSKNS